MKRQSGFTLIEIMVVLVIIGILTALVALNVGDEPGKARIVKATSDIRVLENALDTYKIDNFRYPSQEQGLRALIVKPDGDPEPKNYKRGGYIKHLEKDPWDNDYQYLNPGEHGEIDIVSLGADGEVGGEGDNADVGNWDEEDER